MSTAQHGVQPARPLPPWTGSRPVQCCPLSTGVYGFVRHPLYLGCLMMMLGAPLLLGSVCGLIIALIGFVAIVGRIVGEERILASELEGYEDYRHKVKYRLVPLIW